MRLCRPICPSRPHDIRPPDANTATRSNRSPPRSMSVPPKWRQKLWTVRLVGNLWPARVSSRSPADRRAGVAATLDRTLTTSPLRLTIFLLGTDDSGAPHWPRARARVDGSPQSLPSRGDGRRPLGRLEPWLSGGRRATLTRRSHRQIRDNEKKDEIEDVQRLERCVGDVEGQDGQEQAQPDGAISWIGQERLLRLGISRRERPGQQDESDETEVDVGLDITGVS